MTQGFRRAVRGGKNHFIADTEAEGTSDDPLSADRAHNDHVDRLVQVPSCTSQMSLAYKLTGRAFDSLKSLMSKPPVNQL
jgi:hypothetical protein